jgi:hypothetical protein
MVKAILEGRKTQTRRVMKPQPIKQGKLWIYEGAGWSDNIVSINPVPNHSLYEEASYGKPGDLLWVRETWGRTALDKEMVQNEILYKADYSHPDQAKAALSTDTWRPSIYMPKSACRIWLMIEDIRLERVQDISSHDAIAEGIERISNDGMLSFRSYAVKYDARVFPYVSFQTLWASINGEESWNANPWVWVIQFRVLSTTGKPSDEVIDRNYREVTANCERRLPTGREASHV